MKTTDDLLVVGTCRTMANGGALRRKEIEAAYWVWNKEERDELRTRGMSEIDVSMYFEREHLARMLDLLRKNKVKVVR